MSKKRIVFSPVTRLSGLLSIELFLDHGQIAEANASSTMFRGFEWIMRDRHVTDAVYMTQRVCGICSTAHGAVASYLLDELYDNEIQENAQYLRNIMYAADFIQNHLRHFYLFSMPDFVRMPDYPPFHGQDLTDARLSPGDNQRLVEHYFEGIKASQKSHEILALFGGKAPHQHSFLHGGVSVAPTVDKITRALSLIAEINHFVKNSMLPDTNLISRVYNDYFRIGITPRRLLSFGLFKFGEKNEKLLWKSGTIEDNNKIILPQVDLIEEDIAYSWFAIDENKSLDNKELKPDPYKPGAYTWVKSVKYAQQHFEVGPLARMIINGYYNGGTSTMDRIYARSLETYLLTEFIQQWLKKLTPGDPPIKQKTTPVKNKVTAVTDAMRGALLHSAYIEDEQVLKYDIITPTVWNFSPKDKNGQRGPVENAIVNTNIPSSDMLFTIAGRIVRSFDPCIACGTHVIDCNNNLNITHCEL
ncbi:MAG: nickel-dependent hydrogenase large subunit [Clostridiales bacterium]|nr:nickel-dependent hydrogenase large subunit [Clostridiales bacterium]MCF8021801.1 nickel-dependent hydrogenase large subunit [Clostridiales bacterium]